MPRRVAAVVLCCAAAFAPLAAHARASVHLRGGRVFFFTDTLALVARDGAVLTLDDGTVVRGDAAYLNLREDRALIAGHASSSHGGAAAAGDAIAVQLDRDEMTVLDASAGARTMTRALGLGESTGIDPGVFTFPEVLDDRAYIRGRRADIVLHANVRMTPAAFPTSVGAVPVPTYLYTFAPAAGFASNALGGASFDQPYGITGSANALTAVHARWLDGTGASVGLQQHIVRGDDAYLTAAVDAPLRAASTTSWTAYRRMDRRTTFALDGSGSAGSVYAHTGLTASFGAGGARLDYTRTSTQYSTLDLAVRSPDVPFASGATVRLTGHLGFDAQAHGLLTALPDVARYGTVWRHAVDAFVATPVVRLPLRTSFAGTLDLARTWHAFPHTTDTLEATGQLSRTLSKRWSLFAGYDARYGHDVYPGTQALFYPPTIPVLPDGAPYRGYLAYSGASMLRLANLDAQWTPDATTSVRLSLRESNDFPQFAGYGRPRTELRADARFRPFPNIGLSVGRAYDFGWGGTRWVPHWSFSVMP